MGVRLLRTMNEILSFANDKMARKRYKQFMNRSEDAAALIKLDKQLAHAFQIFQVCTR
jgi:hypothetical protein